MPLNLVVRSKCSITSLVVSDGGAALTMRFDLCTTAILPPFLCPGHGLEIILYPFGGTSLNVRSASSLDSQVSVNAHIVGERSVIYS